jgi:hypothetical protein
MFKGTLDKEYKYIAKDFDGTWYLYKQEPVLEGTKWKGTNTNNFVLLPLIPDGLEDIEWTDSLHLLVHDDNPTSKPKLYYVED